MTANMRTPALVALLGLVATVPGQLLTRSGGNATVVRLQEIANFCGVQSNHLSGIGVVVGLSGTGDSNAATRKRLANFLASKNINVDAGQLASGNLALVTVTCELPPFLAEGSRVDLTVSASQDASSLFGGELLFCTLSPGTGNNEGIYVVGQGAVSTGGFSAGGGSAKVTRNHPTGGRVAGGGIVEKRVPMKLLSPEGILSLRLYRPAPDTVDFICRALRTISGLESAVTPFDFGRIDIRLDPLQQKRANLIPLIAKIQGLPVRVGGSSKVVINEKTGTIVVGSNIKVSKVTILKGNLTISITEDQAASQPNPFAQGETKVLKRTSVDVVEGRGEVMNVRRGANLGDVVAMMNRMGASPRDILAILQDLHKQGAIHAQLEHI